MKQSLLILLALLGFGQPLFAQSIRSYDALVMVPIVEEDRAFAQTQAFRDLRYQILGQAAKDLIGDDLYAEYQDLFLQQRALDPNYYLSSVKVLNEEVLNRKLSVTMQADVRLESLQEKLTQMNFPIKGEKPLGIGLVKQAGLGFPEAVLQKRLALFGLAIQEKATLKLPPREQLEDSGYIASLFEKMPNQNLIFLLEARPEPGMDDISGVGVRIYRKSDQSQVSSFFMSFKPIPLPQVEAYLKKNEQQFAALFSIKTLQRSTFHLGSNSAITLRVKGLLTPKDRFQYESRALRKNPLIQSFSMVYLSGDECHYQINAKADQSQVAKSILQAPGVAQQLMREEGKILHMVAKVPTEPLIEDLEIFNAKEGHIARIAEALGVPSAAEVSSEFVPGFMEKENNNTSLTVNPLPVNVLVYGVISSRADQDLFILDLPPDQQKLTIEWFKLSRTRLKPMLTLYDQDFNFLNSYRLTSNTSQNKIEYTFREGAVPSRVILRLSDQVGFIQKETGGFLNFGYMLRFRGPSLPR